jgi:hypothetical protein
MKRTAHAIFVVTLLVSGPAWPRNVDLLPLIDPQKDAVCGQWKIEDGTLVSGREGSPERSFSAIQIPYEPPAEYDFRIVFVRIASERDIAQIMCKAGRSFAWLMGVSNNTQCGFALVNGCRVWQKDNPTTVIAAASTYRKPKCESIVKVRNSGLEAYVDGKRITQWRTDYKDLTTFPACKLKNDLLLGLATNLSPTRFYTIEVKEVTGKGTIVPHKESPAGKRESKK